jgi:hypothetical protein
MPAIANLVVAFWRARPRKLVVVIADDDCASKFRCGLRAVRPDRPGLGLGWYRIETLSINCPPLTVVTESDFPPKPGSEEDRP